VEGLSKSVFSHEQLIDILSEVIREFSRLNQISLGEPPAGAVEFLEAFGGLQERVRVIQVTLFKELESDFAADGEDSQIRRRSIRAQVFDAVCIISGELSRFRGRFLESLKQDDAG
jgi:hypothetical protein